MLLLSVLEWRQTASGRLLLWGNVRATPTLSSCTKYTLTRYHQNRAIYRVHVKLLAKMSGNEWRQTCLRTVSHVFSDGASARWRTAGEDQEEETLWWSRGQPVVTEPGLRRQLHARGWRRAQRPQTRGELWLNGLLMIYELSWNDKEPLANSSVACTHTHAWIYNAAFMKLFITMTFRLLL